MQLSPEDIKEFQKIYKEEYGEEITEAEAEKMGSNFLNLYALIYSPTKESDS